MLRKDFTGYNLVLIARNFNPSLFSQFWFIKNNLLSEHDFAQGCIFTETLAQINTVHFSLVISPQQLQFYPKDKLRYETDLSFLFEVLDIVRHTPFVAIGFNFTWNVSSINGNISRSLFFNHNNPLYNSYESNDARFGAYLSKNVENIKNTRLRLNIIPVLGTINNGQENAAIQEYLQFSFNYQIDNLLTVNEPIQIIENFIRNWRVMVDTCHTQIDSL